MEPICWGIIGCGDVTELKSGPAFNKVPGSALVAVMRRDAEQAKNYAERHKVPKWYNNAASLINDPEVNAIYIATPPSTHELYTIEAINAGKPVYVEKPMSVDHLSALNMARYAEEKQVKLVVAHYRRAQPKFQKIKQLLGEKAIGDPLFARLDYLKSPLSTEELQIRRNAWRVDPAIAGGGLFHDLAPHQLDLMLYYFGDVEHAFGIAVNQSALYNAPDIVSNQLLFKSGLIMNGLWNFNVADGDERDLVQLTGTRGSIYFNVFNLSPVTLVKDGNRETFSFDPLEHVQQPMIKCIVDYFSGRAGNPCSGFTGAEVMRLIDKSTGG